MNEEKQFEEMELTEVDILANELNQHCADLAENYCGDITCLTCLAHAVIDKGYRKASEVAREIFAEIEKRGRKVQSSDFSGEFWSRGVLMSDLAELKKKYTEEVK